MDVSISTGHPASEPSGIGPRVGEQRHTSLPRGGSQNERALCQRGWRTGGRERSQRRLGAAAPSRAGDRHAPCLAPATAPTPVSIVSMGGPSLPSECLGPESSHRRWRFSALPSSQLRAIGVASPTSSRKSCAGIPVPAGSSALTHVPGGEVHCPLSVPASSIFASFYDTVGMFDSAYIGLE
jgi:hypothetical protein